MWDSSVRSEEAAVLAALRSGRIGSEDEVDALERDLAAQFGCTAVTTSSGSTAIELVLRARRVGPGRAVVVPALTCRSVADAVVAAGARPVFADVDEATLTIDVSSAATVVDERVGAVIAVDQYGAAAPVGRLRRSVGADVLVVHDVAASFGLATGPPPHQVVRVASLHGSKVYGVGEGGVVLTCDAALAERVRYLRSPGALSVRGIAPPPDLIGAPGFSARMSDLDAALARSRFGRLPVLLGERRARAAAYRRALAPMAHRVGLPAASRHAFACFPVRLPDAAIAGRVAALAAERRLPLEHCHGTLHEPVRDRCPVAERVVTRTVCLPTSRAVDVDAYAAVLADAAG